MGDKEDINVIKVQPFPVAQQPASAQHSHIQYPPSGQYPPTGQHPPPGGQYGASGQVPGVAYQQPGVVYTQPGIVPPGTIPPDVWMMPPPQPLSGCPPGLEYFLHVDQFICEQLPELLKVGTELNNKYKIKNSLGQNIYFAEEDVDTFSASHGAGRAFNIRISDSAKKEVIHLHRPRRFPCFCCVASCLHEIEVQAPPGTTIGYIMQTSNCCVPKFDICDEERNPILKLVVPFVCGDLEGVEFKVVTIDSGSDVAKLKKQARGGGGGYTLADTFVTSFPMDLDVKAKASMLGAVMMIDFMFCDGMRRALQNNQNGGRVGP